MAATARGLRNSGFAVDVADRGEDALAKTAVTAYDVVVLDRDLPGIHGDDVCRSIAAGSARILMLTAFDSLDDRVAGLGLGADDYLVKPFHLRELVARIHALGRRPAQSAAPVLEEHGGPTQLDNLILLCHYHHHSVHEGGWNVMGSPGGWQFIDPTGNPHAVPVLRLPTTAPLAQSAALSGTSATNSVGERSKDGPAGPLAGTGERANLDFIADVVIANSELRKQRLGLT